MFSTSGYFRHLDCPFLLAGLCERPHCHFGHSAEPRRVNYFVSQSDVNNFTLLPTEEYNPTESIFQEKPSYSPAVSVNTSNIKSVDVIADSSLEEYVEDEVVDIIEDKADTVSEVMMKDQSVSTDDFPENNGSKKGSTESEMVANLKKRSISAEEMKRIIFDSSSDDNNYEDVLYWRKETTSNLRDNCKERKVFKNSNNDDNDYEENISKVHKITEKMEDKGLKKKKKRPIQYSSSDEEINEKMKGTTVERMNNSMICQKKHKMSHYQINNEEKEIKISNKKIVKEKSLSGNVKEIDVSNKATKVRDQQAADLKIVKKATSQREKTIEEKEYEEMEDALLSGRIRGRKLATVDILRFRMILAERDKAKKQ